MTLCLPPGVFQAVKGGFSPEGYKNADISTMSNLFLVAFQNTNQQSHVEEEC
jgi:hypothetical protein